MPVRIFVQGPTMHIGHRLKSASNKTTAVLRALRSPRRIILSGTPIQNDLGEFHAMASSVAHLPIICFFGWHRLKQAEFCNPGLLGWWSTWLMHRPFSCAFCRWLQCLPSSLWVTDLEESSSRCLCKRDWNRRGTYRPGTDRSLCPLPLLIWNALWVAFDFQQFCSPEGCYASQKSSSSQMLVQRFSWFVVTYSSMQTNTWFLLPQLPSNYLCSRKSSGLIDWLISCRAQRQSLLL